jgi:hypothetical protein
MGFFSKISLNDLYILKLCDFFAFDVKLRLQRSKEGGRSDQRIGSWFGVFMSLMLVGIIIQFCSSKINNMNDFENVTYNTIEFKNKFAGYSDS